MKAQTEESAGCRCGAHKESSQDEWFEYARICFAGLSILVCWLKLWQPVPGFDLVVLICALLGGYPVYKEAAEDLWSKRMTMELSMTIALTAALIIGEVFHRARHRLFRSCGGGVRTENR